ncbi:MAG: hypothetical protein ACYDDA_10815 [Acidiferrobacteraceae bacterium]
MLLTFCALSGAPCIEIEPAEPPQSMTECLVGGQSAAAEWIKLHAMQAGKLRFAGWKCGLGKREGKA